MFFESLSLFMEKIRITNRSTEDPMIILFVDQKLTWMLELDSSPRDYKQLGRVLHGILG